MVAKGAHEKRPTTADMASTVERRVPSRRDCVVLEQLERVEEAPAVCDQVRLPVVEPPVADADRVTCHREEHERPQRCPADGDRSDDLHEAPWAREHSVQDIER